MDELDTDKIIIPILFNAMLFRNIIANKLNKNQIDFLYNNSSIDSEVYFNMSQTMI